MQEQIEKYIRDLLTGKKYETTQVYKTDVETGELILVQETRKQLSLPASFIAAYLKIEIEPEMEDMPRQDEFIVRIVEEVPHGPV